MLGYKHKSSISQMIDGKTDPTQKFFQMLEIAGIDFESVVSKHHSEMSEAEILMEFQKRFSIEHPELKSCLLQLIGLPKKQQEEVAREILPTIEKITSV